MNASIATCLLLSLVIYHTRTSVVKASTTAYMCTTSYQCVAMGSNIWGTEELSSIICASLCTENDNCKGLIYSGSLRICQFCHSYGLPVQAPSSSGPILFRKTKGDQCDRYLLNDVPDSSLTASSEFTFLTGPEKARLGTDEAWTASPLDNNNNIMVQFSDIKEVMRIETKGGNDDQYVTSYEVFPGNNDVDTSILNGLPEPVLALCVRLRPKAWNMLTTLRFDVIGCDF